MSDPGAAQMIVTVGDAEPRVVSLAVGEPGEFSITVVFPIDRSTVSLTFDADRFVAFVEQLRVFAATMPGKPS